LAFATPYLYDLLATHARPFSHRKEFLMKNGYLRRKFVPKLLEDLRWWRECDT
jgi:hypothetical protein